MHSHLGPIEDVGIEPDVLVDPLFSYGEDRDYLLEEAWSSLIAPE